MIGQVAMMIVGAPEPIAFFFCDNLVSWSSNKQKVMIRSSAEAKYHALALTSSKLIWLQSILHELHVPSSHTPILFCDNGSVKHLTVNLV